MDTKSAKTYEKKSFTTCHHCHPLKYLTSAEKGYSSNGWYCDICKKHYDTDINSMHCILCGWDLCNNCFFKDYQYLE